MATKHEKQNEGNVAVKERPSTKKPQKHKVLLHNDDYTTMQFVIDVLMKFFKKNMDEAMQIMLNVHEKGVGVAGVYTEEIAEAKVQQVTMYAKDHGHPLRCSSEPE